MSFLLQAQVYGRYLLGLEGVPIDVFLRFDTSQQFHDRAESHKAAKTCREVWEGERRRELIVRS